MCLCHSYANKSHTKTKRKYKKEKQKKCCGFFTSQKPAYASYKNKKKLHQLET